MTTRAAQRVSELVEELASTRLGDLGNTTDLHRKLQELQASVAEIQAFAETTGNLIGHFAGGSNGRGTATTARAARPVARRVARPGSRPGRGPGEFSSTPFILRTVQESGKSGIRAGEIVKKVQEAAPGHHLRPSALVSTILTRLKKRGEVRRRAGKWFSAAA